MSDIPADIFADAYRLVALHSGLAPEDANAGPLVDAVARAILAERDRAASCADAERRREGLLVMERNTAERIAAAIGKGVS